MTRAVHSVYYASLPFINFCVCRSFPFGSEWDVRFDYIDSRSLPFYFLCGV